MKEPATKEEVLVVRPWRYRIVRSGSTVLFDLHVESGFASWNEEHPLSEPEAERLVREPRRAMLIFCALHPLRQNRRDVPPGLVREIALGPPPAVSARMDALDREHRGACSNLLRILLDRPERSARIGWFEAEGRAA